MHDVFSDWYRRAILYAVTEGEDPISVPALTEQLVGWKLGRADSLPADLDIPERVRMWVRNTHVTELDRFGALDYDPETDTVRSSDEVTLSIEPPWRSLDTVDAEQIASLSELHELLGVTDPADGVPAEGQTLE